MTCLSPWQAEVGALYLPSLFRTFFNNPIGAFDDRDGPSVFIVLADMVAKQIMTPAGHRFLREHPAEGGEFKQIVLKRLVEVTGWLQHEVNRSSS